MAACLSVSSLLFCCWSWKSHLRADAFSHTIHTKVFVISETNQIQQRCSLLDRQSIERIHGQSTCVVLNKMQSGDKDNEDGWLTSMEEQYLQDIGAEPDYERQYNTERESSMRNVWSSFQESATSIAQLYRGKLCCVSVPAWLHVQGRQGATMSSIRALLGVLCTVTAAVRCKWEENGQGQDWYCFVRHFVSKLSYAAPFCSRVSRKRFYDENSGHFSSVKISIEC